MSISNETPALLKGSERLVSTMPRYSFRLRDWGETLAQPPAARMRSLRPETPTEASRMCCMFSATPASRSSVMRIRLLKPWMTARRLFNL